MIKCREEANIPERENYPDPEGPQKIDHLSQLQTFNMFTLDMENPNRTDKRNVLLVCMP